MQGNNHEGEEHLKCLFKEDMHNHNYNEILKNIVNCKYEDILLDKQIDYVSLVNKIESYINFIKSIDFNDVPENDKPQLKLIAQNLLRLITSDPMTLAAVEAPSRIYYNNIIKASIDFLKTYGKLAEIRKLNEELTSIVNDKKRIEQQLKLEINTNKEGLQQTFRQEKKKI